VDAALIVEAYHEMEEPVLLLKNVAAKLKPKGLVGIIEFTKEGGGPGPEMEERVDPERVVRDAEAAGLRLVRRETFLRYQYMLVFGHAAS
jgi:predicted methyltransferase